MLSLLLNIHLKEVADQNKKERTPGVSDAVENETKSRKSTPHYSLRASVIRLS